MKIVFIHIWLIAFVFMVSLSGCKNKHLSSVERTVNTDTVYKETVRDSLIFMPTDSAFVFALLDCDSLNNVYLKKIDVLQGNRTAVNMSANQDTSGFAITTTCICDSISIYFAMKDRYYATEKTSNTVKNVVSKTKCNLIKPFLYGSLVGALLTIILILLIKHFIKWK